MHRGLNGEKFISGSTLFIGMFASVGVFLVDSSIDVMQFIWVASFAAVYGLVFSLFVFGVTSLVGSRRVWLNFLIAVIPGLFFSTFFLFFGCGSPLEAVLTFLVLPMAICSAWLAKLLSRDRSEGVIII